MVPLAYMTPWEWPMVIVARLDRVSAVVCRMDMRL